MENFFVESVFIDQIYVHGDVAKSFLLAVVVPSAEVAEQWCKLHEKEFDLEMLCKDFSFAEEIHKDIVRLGAKNRVSLLFPNIDMVLMIYHRSAEKF